MGKIALDRTFPQTISSNGRYSTSIPSISRTYQLTHSNLDVNAIHICQNGGRPGDQFVNFLIQWKVSPVEGRLLSRTARTKKFLTAEVAAEEAGPWRSCGKRLRVEDLPDVCQTVVFHGMSGGG